MTNNDNTNKSRVTIYDIAKHMGLSPCTVNRALTNTGRVSEETRRRVIDVAAQLGYRPSFVARSLKNSSTKLIGVVVPLLGATIYSSMVQGVERAVYERGYNIVVCLTECDREREDHLYDLLYQRRVEGLISVSYSPHEPGEPYKELLDMEDRGIPVVAMEQNITENRVCKVVVDNFGAAKEITEHLISLGHTRIGHAHIGLSNWDFSGRERLAGYQAALAEAGIERDDALVGTVVPHVNNPFDESSLEKPFLDYMKRARPTAVFVNHDMLALKILQVCAFSGIRVPQDLAIVGFDDILASAYTIPPLTTIHQPSVELGERAAEILFQRIEGKLKVHVHERMLGRLIVRESCGARLASGTDSTRKFNTTSV